MVALLCAEGEENADFARALVRRGQHAAEHAEKRHEKRDAADSEEQERAERGQPLDGFDCARDAAHVDRARDLTARCEITADAAPDGVRVGA